MKKNVLGWALLGLICGIVFILLGLSDKTLTHGSLIIAMGCGSTVGAISTFYKYFHWLNPGDKLIYEEHLKNEIINLRDERKIMLREKAGRITYAIMFVVLIILNIVFTFIGVEKWIILTLWGVIAFKYICGVAVFYYLAKRM